MFGGMGKGFWGLRVSFSGKKLRQNRLFHTTNNKNLLQ